MPDKPPAASDPVLFRFFNEVGIIEQLARNQFERVMPHAMSLAQFSLLNHFVRLGGERSLADLARSFQVSRAAMTKLVRKLETAGFVRVQPNPTDSRGKLVSVTPRGERARNAAIAALAPLLGQLQREFDREDVERALPLLERMRAWLDTHRPG